MSKQHWSERIKVERGDRIWRFDDKIQEWLSVIYWCEHSFQHARSSARPTGWYRLTDYFVGVVCDDMRYPNNHRYVNCWDYDTWLSQAEYDLIRSTKGV
jgi:hypothetical protein